MQPNACVECGTSLEGKQGWVRSGRLLCNDCDFAHKAPSRQVVRRPRQPKPRGTYWKPQVWRTATLAWADIQVACTSADQALSVAVRNCQDGGQYRAMRVDPDGTRTPTAAHIYVP